MSENLTPEKALFIEQKTKELFDYSIACLDRAQTEGNTVLQWLFAVTAGGLGIMGSLVPNGYWTIAGGCLVGSGWAAWSAACLIRGLHTRDTMPPGNYCEFLNTLLDEPEHRMRWREARGMDGRIRTNIAHLAKLAKSVDRARNRFALLPVWFVGGIAVTWLVLALVKTNRGLLDWITSVVGA